MSTKNTRENRGSTAVEALSAAGDTVSANDVRELDSAARGVDEKLAAHKQSLVERLIYGPMPDPVELQSGARLAKRLERDPQPIADAALACLAEGRAFTADGAVSETLRRAVTKHKAYGFTVPVEFGGEGASYPELARIEETLAANGLGALAVEISGQLTIGAGSVLAYGSEEQRRAFLPMLVEGRLMGFALTEVAVGMNANKIQAYVEEDVDGNYRLFAEAARNKLWITNARHGGLVGLVARIGRGGREIGLFIVELPDHDVAGHRGEDFEYRCEPSSVAAFTANFNSRLHFKNFPIPRANRVPADGVEVLFYCLRMGRCMLAAMSAGYQLMLARDASLFATRRIGVGGPVIGHELPRLAIGRMLGGALQARALAYLSLKQDADGVDLAGLRDITKSAAATAGVESMIACEHVLGGRSFHRGKRVNEARVNLHLFGVVEGEDDMIRMGMVRDITRSFVDRYLGGLLAAIESANVDGRGEPLPASERFLRIGFASLLAAPRRGARALRTLVSTREFWRLLVWIAHNAARDAARWPWRLLPSAVLPRYQSLPARLRPYVRFAERKLRNQRWAYLGLSLIYQLELAAAQVVLQRFGLRVEYLVCMLAVCHQSALEDEGQQRIAELQAQLLKDKFDGTKLVTSLREVQRLRRSIAVVGEAVAEDRCSLFQGVAAEAFAHPWVDQDLSR